jgi:hypothetical protein
VNRWEATPAERAAVLEGGRPVTATLAVLLLALCILVAMAVDVIA